MNIKLYRFKRGPNFTLGEIYINDEFECYSVEDTVRLGPKIYGKTAIPEGRYKIAVTFSNRFQKNLPLLIDVPGFSGIRIHPGNTAEDTEGCILPGRKLTENGVGESRLAFNQLFSKIQLNLKVNREVFITIENRAKS